MDPLQTIKPHEQRGTPRHENETEKQRANRETRGHPHTAIQSSFDLGIGLISRRCRVLLGRGWVNFRDIVPSVILWGDKNNFIGYFDFYRRDTEA